MANHDGYIFLAPNGTYLTQRTHSGHTQNGKAILGLTIHMDAATLFATDDIVHLKGDWSFVRDTIRDICRVQDIKDIREYLVPMRARSYQSILLRPVEENDEPKT